jgi:hypothetical protein
LVGCDFVWQAVITEVLDKVHTCIFVCSCSFSIAVVLML